MSAQKPDDTRIICARRSLESDYGPVSVWMTVPREETETGNFVCDYGIDGPRTARRGSVMGLDAFQALQLTLERIGTELLFSEEGQTGGLRWLDTAYETGFPAPDGENSCCSDQK
jgi:hypothetical protein